MARVRAVTVFVAPDKWSKESIMRYVEDAAVRAMEVAEYLKKRIDVWTVRVALPPLPENTDPVEVAEAAYEAAHRNGVKYVAAVHVNAGSKALERFVDAIEVGVYGSILLSRAEYVRRVAHVLLDASRRDLMIPTRMAVVFGTSWPLTPYFPIAVQTRSGVGLGLAAFYVNDLLAVAETEPVSFETIRQVAIKVFEVIEEAAREAAEEKGIEYYGVDVSLSPWMEESVARLIERLLGDERIGSPGTLSIIRELNRVVQTVASTFEAIGFNEIMLPVAEDVVLKERVGEGLVRIRDLMLYSNFCVAGVDMVVANVKREDEVTRLVEDMYALYKVKGMSIGLRVILVDWAPPGQWISLGEFGKVPVAWW